MVSVEAAAAASADVVDVVAAADVGLAVVAVAFGPVVLDLNVGALWRAVALSGWTHKCYSALPREEVGVGWKIVAAAAAVVAAVAAVVAVVAAKEEN